MKRGFTLLLALLMLTTLCLTACGGDASSTAPPAGSSSKPASSATGSESTGDFPELNAEVEYWCSWNASEPQAEVLARAAEAFMDKYPGVKLNITFNGRDNRKLLVPAIESGTKVDMMCANVDNMMSLWSDHLKPIDEFYTMAYPTTNGNTYEESIMSSMVALADLKGNGTRYYIPYCPQALMFFYNKDIFDDAGVTEVPTTWEAFMEACEKIKNAGYYPMMTDDYYAPNMLGYILDRMKGDSWVEDLVKDSSKKMWNDPAVLTAVQMVAECAEKGYFAPSVLTNIKPAGQQEMVIEEKAAMYLNGTWLPVETQNSTREDFRWGQFAFPTVSGGANGLESGAYSSWGMAINKAADDATTQAAVAFAVFVTTGEWDQEMANHATAIPMMTSATWPEALSDAKAILSGYTTRFAAQTAIRLNADLLPILQTTCTELCAGVLTPEQFIAEMQK